MNERRLLWSPVALRLCKPVLLVLAYIVFLHSTVASVARVVLHACFSLFQDYRARSLSRPAPSTHARTMWSSPSFERERSGMDDTPRENVTPSSVEIAVETEKQPSGRGPCMRGVLVQPDQAYGSVLFFASYVDGNDNACILVAGLGQGMMSFRWLPSFAQALDRLGFATVQINLSSSFGSCGLSSLHQDARELEVVVRYLRREMNVQKVVIAGHSTGSQDVITYLQHIRMKQEKYTNIDACILLSGVSDREAIGMSESSSRVPQLREEALKLVEKGQADCILSQRIMNCYFTAERFLSLTERLGKDDMFSTDLSAEELQRIFSAVNIPCLCIYAEQDEHVPDMEKLRSFSQRLKTVLLNTSPQVEVTFLRGNHGFEEDADSATMIDVVCKFLERFD